MNQCLDDDCISEGTSDNDLCEFHERLRFHREITDGDGLKLADMRDERLGAVEPPNDPRVFNRRQSDGTFRSMAEFFDRPQADEADGDTRDAETAQQRAEYEAYRVDRNARFVAQVARLGLRTPRESENATNQA